MKVVGLLGSGGQADETQSFLSEDFIVKFRAVNKDYIENIDDIDIENPNSEDVSVPVISAVGSPVLRKKLLEKWPGNSYFNCISSHAHINDSVEIGTGCIVAPGVVVNANVKIKDHSVVNNLASISHGTTIGSFVTIGPGVNVAGNVVINDGVFIGIGATILNKVTIASGVVIGAGAVVLHDISEENTVWVGVPAQKIKKNEGWIDEV